MITKHAPNVHEISNGYNGNNKLFFYGLFSDIHFDATDCHRQLLKKHFDKVKENKGLIFIIGDLFDVMGCYKDPRSKAAHIRPEYIKADRSYLDLIIEDCANFLKPYAENIALIGYGNHETAIMKHRDTDPIQRIAAMIGRPDVVGGYSGYVRFSYRHNSGGSIRSFIMYYHHGYGGAKRSKGILNAQIDGFANPDADLIISGHDHNKLHDPSNVRFHLTANNKIVHSTQHWIKTGSYVRNDETPGVNGWHVEKAFLPRRLGGWFMRHEITGHKQDLIPVFEEAI